MAPSLDDIRGFEYDWLAMDQGGLVAFFSTAGGGYAPDAFLRDIESHDCAIEALLVGSATTMAKFAPKVAPGLKNTWLLAAERGLYAFDADPLGGPYRLVAAPLEPTSVNALPPDVASIVRRVPLPTINFGDLNEISNELLSQLT